MRSHDEFLRVERLVKAGQCDKEIARVTGIPRRTISGWRRGEVGFATGPTVEACGTKAHDFTCLPPKPYAYLLGLYLGDGCISAAPRRVYRTRIVLDIAYPGIIDECCAALEAIFPDKTAHRLKRNDSNCIEISM